VVHFDLVLKLVEAVNAKKQNLEREAFTRKRELGKAD